MRTSSLLPIVCVGCGKLHSRFEDFGMVGQYPHCDAVNCRNTAYNMVEEDHLFGLSDSDEEPLVIPFPAHFDRAA